jgi:hypothetical protein
LVKRRISGVDAAAVTGLEVMLDIKIPVFWLRNIVIKVERKIAILIIY